MNLKKELKELIIKAKNQGWLSDKDFANAIQYMFITYPLVDTGNRETVNAELLLYLIEECKKHKISYNNLKH